MLPSRTDIGAARVADHPGRSAEALLAYSLSALLAVRYFVNDDYHLGSMVGLLFLPITLPILRRYRGGWLIFGLAVAGAIGGGLLTQASAVDHTISNTTMIQESFRILAIGVCVVTLLWARSVIGLYRVALSYGIGGIASLVVVGINPANPWKFSLSVPVILIALSIPWVTRNVTRQFVVMVILAAASGIADSRSLAATLLIAAALLLTRRKPGQSRRTRAGMVILQIAAIAVGGFFALQGAILEGILGEEIQARTEVQIDTSGSVITGGRPELGATVALLRSNPWGFGTGTLPSYRDISIAKEGMAALGYNPEHNGYVDRYMFGSKFEVHSTIGDLWLLGGIFGGLLAIAMVCYSVYGMASSIATGAAAGVALFLGVRTVWDTFFSPLGTTFFTVALCVALLLPEVARRTDPGPTADLAVPAPGRRLR